MEVTQKFAQFIVDTGFEQIPEEAVTATKRALLDTLGVALAGSKEPAGRIIADFIKKQQSAPKVAVIGTGFRTSAPEAALAIGTMAHALDYDDTCQHCQGHPSVPLLAAAFPLAEELGASGRQVIEAYVIGCEIWGKIGSVMTQLHFRGWHPTAVFGTIGAAAAAAKLLHLNVTETEMALGLAGSQACGLTQNFGTMTKPFHGGNSARSGIIAAMLVKEGFTATHDVFEGHMSFPVAFYGERDFDLTRATENLGQPFAVLSPGINVKKYPTCYGTHRSIDAMLHLIDAHDISPDEVAKVQCFVPPRTTKLLFYDNPCTELEGKFSMQFCMAAALTDRKVGLSQVRDEKVNNPQIKELMKKVTLSIHPDWIEGESSETRPDVVTVILKDGREYTYQVDKARGHADVPLSWEELLVKYRDCAGLVMEKGDVERSIELLEGLEEIGDIKELMDIVIGNGRET
jgi:2-methylcitrate dehydratase PrpD